MSLTTVLIIGYVWPESTSSAAGLRSMGLVDAFLKAGWTTWFISPSKENEFTESLRQLGVQVGVYEANDPKFDELLKGLQPDLVIYDRFVIEEQFGARVHEHSPRSVRVVDTQDLHFLRRARMDALKGGASVSQVKEAAFDLLTEDALREISAIYRSDLTLVLSNFERDLLCTKFGVPESLLELNRFSYSDYDQALPSFDQRQGFVMIGNFRHPPNRDGFFWLAQQIWPRIRQLLPQAELHVYGAYPPKEVMQLHQPEAGFHVLGWVRDQFEALKKYRVNLAPLRFGAGIKGKISDGWRVGTPVVTTSIGMEGMHEDLEFGGLQADDADLFAQAAVSLNGNRELWDQLQGRGTQIIKALYSRELESQKLIARLEAVRSGLQEIRSRNLVGAMLWHHSHRSTMYFSKWIEAKNQNKTK